MTISSVPTSPAVGQEVKLATTLGHADVAQFELTSKPAGSRLALGIILERHPTVARTVSVPLTFTAEVTALEQPATITRQQGSFVDEGFVAEMGLDIAGTANNDKRVTLAAVEARKLTLAPRDTLTTESITASLTAQFFGRGGGPAQVFTPDAPGEYGITAHGYYQFAAPPMYSGDPSGGVRTQYVGNESTTLHVGGYVELPIAPVNGHGSTLRLLVVNETVRGAELVNPFTELARLAALDTTVAAAVSAMVGVTVANLDVDFVTDVNTLATKYAAHILLVGGGPVVHTSQDTTNTLLREAANSIPSAIRRLNDIAAKLLAHMEAGTSGGSWHSSDDGKNTLQVAPTATTLGEAVVLKADLRERAYERHRIQTASPASHGLADSTNTMDAPLTLPAAIVAYLDFVAAASSAVAGEPEGIADAVAGLGFRAA